MVPSLEVRLSPDLAPSGDHTQGHQEFEPTIEQLHEQEFEPTIEQLHEVGSDTADNQGDLEVREWDSLSSIAPSVEPGPGVTFENRPRGFRARWRASGKQPLILQTTDILQDTKRAKLEQAQNDAEHAKTVPLDSSVLGNIQQTAQLEAMRRFRTNALVLPWEKGPLAPLFGGQSILFPKPEASEPKMPLIGLVDTLNPVPTSASSSQVSLPIRSKFAEKRIASARVTVSDDEMRSKALNQVKTLILLDVSGTALGQSMCNLAGTLDENADIAQVLSDAFANKATGTICKRVSSLWLFAEWLIRHGGNCIWDVTEQEAYEHMCYLRSVGSAPTKPTHLVEALRFAHAVLRFSRVDLATVLSNRVVGAAHSMYVQKRKLKQAPQLTVDMVHTLETLCIEESSTLTTLVSGALLFCVFGCARWSDVSRLEKIWTDEHAGLVIVEAESSKHKTSRSKEDKTRLLPYTAIGNFMEEKSWGKAFVKAWLEVNQNARQVFLPSWNDRAGSWASAPMSTTEATCFLRELLEPTVGPEEVMVFSSHSCKPTLLTWVGMYEGISREERTLLGHHVEPNTKSATTYNRDAQLMLQAKVARVLAMIRSSELKPDAGRAHRLFDLVDKEEHTQVIPEPATPEQSEESDYDEDEPQTAHNEVINKKRPKMPDELFDEFSLVAHRLTGTIHVVKDFGEGLLACGRHRTVNMEDLEQDSIDPAVAAFCQQCSTVMTVRGY